MRYRSRFFCSRITRLCLLTCLFGACFAPSRAVAQDRVAIELGLKAGVPLKEPLASNICCSTANFVHHEFGNKPYLAGPSVGVILYDRLRVEFDAVYMPVKFTTIGGPTCCPISIASSTRHGASWEFPLLADYRWLRGSVRPFTGGGFVLRNTTSGGRNQSPAPALNGGVEWSRQRLSIRPEFRFIHYPQNSGANDIGRASRQMQFLVGFYFQL